MSRRCLLLLLLVSFSLSVAAQRESLIIKDLDKDRIADTCYLDTARSVIGCRLSSQNFKEVASHSIWLDPVMRVVAAWKGGFAFSNNFMRAGYKATFRYEAKTKKTQLVGYSRYEFGNAGNDGSGEDSLNLLTGAYAAQWFHYDWDLDSLIALPPIQMKWDFPAVRLQDFSEEVMGNYYDKSRALYQEQLEKYRKRKK